MSKHFQAPVIFFVRLQAFFGWFQIFTHAMHAYYVLPLNQPGNLYTQF